MNEKQKNQIMHGRFLIENRPGELEPWVIWDFAETIHRQQLRVQL